MMRPGLDGQPDTVSFESVDKPGHYVTALSPRRLGEGTAKDAAAAMAAVGSACRDVEGACTDATRPRGPCELDECECDGVQAKRKD